MLSLNKKCLFCFPMQYAFFAADTFGEYSVQIQVFIALDASKDN